MCFHVCRHSPVFTSHSLHELSAEPVSRRVDEKLTTTDHTAPQCPEYVPIRSPFSAYQRHGVWSFAHVKRRSPSRLYLTMVSGRSCPFTMMGRILPMAPHELRGGAARFAATRS